MFVCILSKVSHVFQKKAMKKSKLSDILNVFFYFNTYVLLWKKAHFYGGPLLTRLKKTVGKRGFAFHSYSNQKNILNYITSRNMRKTITPSSFNENPITLNNKINNINIKDVINLFFHNWQKPKKLLTNRSLKFHMNMGHQGNLISKKPAGKPKEIPEDWGGEEAFKLIKHIAEDFDEFIKKNESVLVFFHAYWCAHCRRLKKPYGSAALLSKEANLNVIFAAVDVTVSPEIADDNGVVGIPMIKFYRNGKFITNFKGKRTANDIFQFVKNPPEKPDVENELDI